jgi:hypothetical protein
VLLLDVFGLEDFDFEFLGLTHTVENLVYRKGSYVLADVLAMDRLFSEFF